MAHKYNCKIYFDIKSINLIKKLTCFGLDEAALLYTSVNFDAVIVIYTLIKPTSKKFNLSKFVINFI